MSRRRVVITGLGIISPVGNSIEEAWKSITAGRSGVTRITRFDSTPFASQVAGEVKDFDVGAYLNPKEARRMDLFIQYGMAAGIQAVRDAGLDTAQADGERIGVYIGSGIGGLNMIEATHTEFIASGVRKVSPFFIPSTIINMISGHLSILYGFKGPNLSIVTACTTGTHAIGESARLIEYGDADVMVAGGAESAITRLSVGGFGNMKALTGRNNDPTGASRPWDVDRDGFVLAEGSGIVVLEEYEHAKARGANIYAELAGYGMSADAHHMTAPCDDGDGAMRCMNAALKNAGLNADQVDYINAHGTSTPLGDKAETIAIKRALGDHAYKTAVSSTKSMTGHLLGASGGVEAVFSALAVAQQVAPPTINLAQPGEGCDLDYVPQTAREMKMEVALSNSFGFGGTNATLVFRRV